MCSQYIKNIHTAYIHVISRFAMCGPLNMLPWFGNSEPNFGCPDSGLCTLPITLSIFQLHALLRMAPVLLSCWDRRKWPEMCLFRCNYPINIMKIAELMCVRWHPVFILSCMYKCMCLKGLLFLYPICLSYHGYIINPVMEKLVVIAEGHYKFL